LKSRSKTKANKTNKMIIDMYNEFVRCIKGIDENDSELISHYAGQIFVPYEDAYGDKRYKLK